MEEEAGSEATDPTHAQPCSSEGTVRNRRSSESPKLDMQGDIQAPENATERFQEHTQTQGCTSNASVGKSQSMRHCLKGMESPQPPLPKEGYRVWLKSNPGGAFRPWPPATLA